MLKTNNLVSAYRFENSGTCWAASGRNITVYGAAYADGKFGRCLSFDGVDDYGRFSSGYDFEVGHTICLWANFHNSEGSKYFLGCAERPGIRYNNTTFVVHAGGTGQTFVNWENTQTWAHVTIVRDSANIYNFYIDGVYLGQSNSNTDATLRIIYIGRFYTPYYNYFKGSICELQFYNTKLSVENIRRVMLGLHPF